jgi:hypothetical protein
MQYLNKKNKCSGFQLSGSKKRNTASTIFRKKQGSFLLKNIPDLQMARGTQNL